ncbi:VOC family protein [Microbacterium sp. cx-55]|uniref:VOC family protein n=1 Tax=unclassified Microbacterium TaxID=2609290 RepID=UPI001CBB7912|nr:MULTISPECIES: VOC family protein [unclassified Microbacterium]MBZ4487689.1 VOC family protein [Microbacterium sp. cx-55]MCC4908160.1 VOC family protein [Microbacterium sp. cx-59]UGB35700.1 VOC family protein [Microbacterium sp. cx-55]
MLRLNPYLSFQAETRAAMEFYQSVLGGDLVIDTFEGYEEMGISPDDMHLVMHAQLTTPGGLVLMASDTPPGMPYQAAAGVSVSLSGNDSEALQAAWDGLAADGTVTLPYEIPPWGGKFGMLIDRFGIPWMVAADA